MSETVFRERLHDEIARGGDAAVLVLCPWALEPLPPNVTLLRDPSQLAPHLGQAAPQTVDAGGGREFALAVAAGVLEHLETHDAGALLAALRDLKAARLLIAVPALPDPVNHRSAWPLEQMLAHGLEARGECGSTDARLALYGFDIDRYKHTPDWLNARSWANPENWNRYRW